MKQDDWLLGTIFAATAAAVLLVALDSGDHVQRQARGRQFQSLTGGLGLGCHLDLSHCSWQFDPRLMGDEDPVLDLIVGMSNPWHAISLFPASSMAVVSEGE